MGWQVMIKFLIYITRPKAAIFNSIAMVIHVIEKYMCTCISIHKQGGSQVGLGIPH